MAFAFLAAILAVWEEVDGPVTALELHHDLGGGYHGALGGLDELVTGGDRGGAGLFDATVVGGRCAGAA